MKKVLHGVEFEVEEVDPLTFFQKLSDPNCVRSDMDEETFHALRNNQADKQVDL